MTPSSLSANRRRLTGMLVVALASTASGCDRAPVQARAVAVNSASDAALRERDTVLLREVDALTARCAPAWRSNPECLEQACGLRTRELRLFADVRAHRFSDVAESNYWHRGRLKFPGDLEQLLRRLAEESPSSAPPCAPDGSAGAPPVRR